MKYRRIAKHVLFEAAQNWRLYDQDRLSWFVGRPVTDAEYEKLIEATAKEYDAWQQRLIDQGVIEL